MWLHSGHSTHRSNNSVNSKVATEEIVPEDKATKEATATTTDHLRIKATMHPETVNSASTAKF
jgi:hypothetical protein